MILKRVKYEVLNNASLLDAHIRRNKQVLYNASITKRCDESLMVALEAMNFVCSVYYISCKHVRATRPYD